MCLFNVSLGFVLGFLVVYSVSRCSARYSRVFVGF